MNEQDNCGEIIAVVYNLTKRTKEKLFADWTIIQIIFCAQLGASIRLTVCDLVRVGTEGLFRLCVKTFVAPFLPARLTAPRSPRMVRITLSHLLINSFSRFPGSFAPLEASHLFKIDTVQYCVGSRSFQPSTSISYNFISSSAFTPSFEFAAMLKMHPSKQSHNAL